MLQKINSLTASGSRRSFQKHERALHAACLLCRVLWPTVVPHRHLLFECESEAKTLFLTQRQPR